jgi:hypothetical protein
MVGIRLIFPLTLSIFVEPGSRRAVQSDFTEIEREGPMQTEKELAPRISPEKEELAARRR